MSTVALRRPRSRAVTRKWAVRIFFYAFTIVLSVMFLFPFIWTVSSSLKTSADVVSYPPTLLPRSIQWQNYPTAWNTVVSTPRVCARVAWTVLIAWRVAASVRPPR